MTFDPSLGSQEAQVQPQDHSFLAKVTHTLGLSESSRFTLATRDLFLTTS